MWHTGMLRNTCHVLKCNTCHHVTFKNDNDVFIFESASIETWHANYTCHVFENAGLSDSSSDKSLGLTLHVSGSYFVCSLFLSTVCLTIHFLFSVIYRNSRVLLRIWSFSCKNFQVNSLNCLKIALPYLFLYRIVDCIGFSALGIFWIFQKLYDQPQNCNYCFRMNLMGLIVAWKCLDKDFCFIIRISLLVQRN